MATLEAQAKIDVRLIIAAGTLIDLTNVRDDDAAENTAISDRVVELAAAFVKSYLGDSVDSTDLMAVELTVRKSFDNLKIYTGAVSEVLLQYVGKIDSDLKREAKARRQGKNTVEDKNPDSTAMENLDDLYPQEIWNEED